MLVLTKPLGTGFVTTANKKDECPPEVLARAVAGMTQLNAVGRDALRAAGGAHALTDVTGYGLAGHASEMAEGAGLTVEIDVASLPVIEGVGTARRPDVFHPREHGPTAPSSTAGSASSRPPTRAAPSSPSTPRPRAAC